MQMPMILKEVSLHNIRSYVDETIIFPQGSVLLSGDVGCGKSSLLLAVEFALFGSSRPELPAELLLRKGTTQGSVSLTFELPGKTVKILRHLKKDKDSIKQTSGEIIINSVKKELTPVEMKAEILELLGYPEDLLTKNKNYIYRYTVYTPQEEMKFILQEDFEIRLNVLRRVFNIDKYGLIRENASLYLKNLRVMLAELKARTEPMEQHLQKRTSLTEEQEQLQKNLQELQQKWEEAKLQRQKQQETVKLFEQKYQQAQQVKQKISTLTALWKENERRVQQSAEKLEQIKLLLAELNIPDALDGKVLAEEIQSLEKNQQELLQRKVRLLEKLEFLQKQIHQLRQELVSSEQEAGTIAEKQKKYELLLIEACQKEELIERRKFVEDLFEKTQALITKNQTLLSQSREMQERVAVLATCPTCLQNVTFEHKHKITEQETQKIRQAELILGELQRKRAMLWQQREEVLQQIDELLKKENLLAKISIELQHFAQKQELLKQKKEELRQHIQENNHLMQESEEVNKISHLEQLQALLAEKKRQWQLLTRKELLLKQQQETTVSLEEIHRRMDKIQEEMHQWEEKAVNDEVLLPYLEKEKMQLAERQENERELSVQTAQVATKKEMLLKQLQEVQEILEALTKEKEKLIHAQEIQHWLETFFINLTHAIEKQVMGRVHYLFNQFFQEWFALMIDDEQVVGRIDDTFTPVIEQNGHEISFSYLSGGERTSAALAYRLALNRVINDVIHSIRTKDVLILDEPTDGFSSEQLDKMRDVLEKLGLQQTILVSHESKIESFVENVIRIRKEGHVSVKS